MAEVKTQSLRTFELGTQEGVNVPVWIIVSFQQMERQNLETLNNETSYRPPVASAQ